MLKIIYSKRGTGKTKMMIDNANADVGNVKGDIVFLDKDNHCMLDLKHDIRYFNAQEFGKLTKEYFLGFFGGVLASDYDIEKIYIDGIPSLFNHDELECVIEKVSALAKQNNIEVIMSVSGGKKEMPEYIEEYLFA